MTYQFCSPIWTGVWHRIIRKATFWVHFYFDFIFGILESLRKTQYTNKHLWILHLKLPLWTDWLFICWQTFTLTNDEKIRGASEQIFSSHFRSKKMAGSGVLEGPLSKWTNVMKGWQYRWFVLDEAAGLLSYYTVSYLSF